MKKVDAIIFDMDGTLWDAVDSYAIIWNETLDELGIEHQVVTRDDLLRLMGSYLDDILAQLIPDLESRKAVLERVMTNETAMMPRLGGRLYEGVRETIAELSKRYKLFMVSNCGPGGLENFVDYNGLREYFTELLSHGGTHRPKHENIADLVERYGLENAVYVGDTQGDADSARLAGVPMIWAKYGFGKVVGADAELERFSDLPSIIENLSKTTE